MLLAHPVLKMQNLSWVSDILWLKWGKCADVLYGHSFNLNEELTIGNRMMH